MMQKCNFNKEWIENNKIEPEKSRNAKFVKMNVKIIFF